MKFLLSKKINRIQKILEREQTEVFLIGNFGHQIHDDILYYLLLQKLELGLMIIPATGKPTLYGISFEVPDLQKTYPELVVKPFQGTAASLLQKIIKKNQSIALRPSALPFGIWKQLKKVQYLVTAQKIIGVL